MLRLTGSDGAHATTSDVTITVYPLGTHRLLFDFDGTATTPGNWNNVTDYSAGVKITNP